MNAHIRAAHNLHLFNRIYFIGKGGKLRNVTFVVDDEQKERKAKTIDSIGHIMTLNPETRMADAFKVYIEDSVGRIYVMDYDAKRNHVTSLRRGWYTLEADMQRIDFLKHRPAWLITDKHNLVNQD